MLQGFLREIFLWFFFRNTFSDSTINYFFCGFSNTSLPVTLWDISSIFVEYYLDLLLSFPAFFFSSEVGSCIRTGTCAGISFKYFFAGFLLDFLPLNLFRIFRYVLCGIPQVFFCESPSYSFWDYCINFLWDCARRSLRDSPRSYFPIVLLQFIQKYFLWFV